VSKLSETSDSLGRASGSVTSEKAGRSRNYFTRTVGAYEADDEPLLFQMNEIGRDNPRRSPEDFGDVPSGHNLVVIVDPNRATRTFPPVSKKSWKPSEPFSLISSTISKDNTAGECARQAKLLADFGQKMEMRPCGFGSAHSEEDMLLEDIEHLEVPRRSRVPPPGFVENFPSWSKTQFPPSPPLDPLDYQQAKAVDLGRSQNRLGVKNAATNKNRITQRQREQSNAGKSSPWAKNFQRTGRMQDSKQGGNLEIVNIPLAEDDELLDIPAEMRETVAQEITAFRGRSESTLGFF
jgi:hypothetical protein